MLVTVTEGFEGGAIGSPVDVADLGDWATDASGTIVGVPVHAGSCALRPSAPGGLAELLITTRGTWPAGTILHDVWAEVYSGAYPDYTSFLADALAFYGTEEVALEALMAPGRPAELEQISVWLYYPTWGQDAELSSSEGAILVLGTGPTAQLLGRYTQATDTWEVSAALDGDEYVVPRDQWVRARIVRGSGSARVQFFNADSVLMYDRVVPGEVAGAGGSVHLFTHPHVDAEFSRMDDLEFTFSTIDPEIDGLLGESRRRFW